jgi:hypothetical protein
MSELTRLTVRSNFLLGGLSPDFRELYPARNVTPYCAQQTLKGLGATTIGSELLLQTYLYVVTTFCDKEGG